MVIPRPAEIGANLVGCTCPDKRLIPRAGARQQPKQPDAVADDLGREPIPSVAGASGCRHPTRLLTPVCQRKRESPPAKLTVPPKVTV